MYTKIDFTRPFPELEREVREFWAAHDIIRRSFALNEGAREFTFYDGPPTANGKPHVGHVLTRVIKDIIPRYKVMQGYHVLRKAGWDTHGLPVELEVEKQLGITGKADIEKFGVEAFIERCKASVFTYIGMWEEMSDKIGFWVDMEHPYVTYHNDYIESVWWALGQMWDRGLLYRGHKVLPYCPRCGTALSSHEVAQGYKDVTDMTAFVKFRLKNRENTYILAWTTTPWTLPSNVALAVNKNYIYAEAEQNGERYILAKERLSLLGEPDGWTLIREFPGAELLGLQYEQLLPYVKPDGKAFVVVHGDYVTLSEGTGVVHIAPAYGEDDSVVGRQNNLATLHLVAGDGTFVDSVTDFKGLFVKAADPQILKLLASQGKLYKKEPHTHSYPHCWRCDTPLLYYPKESWFVRSTAYKEQLIANNDSVHWYPDNIRTGRMGNFLENVIDWCVSRDRYWGTPLPIWECECGHSECVGSVARLRELGRDVPADLELHKPYIDAIDVICPKCGKRMTRTPEVIDCWYDAGSMPFAQHHYPFENTELFGRTFPAQFISEAIDQTRGWFYSQLNIATALFGKSSFENCIVLGHVLDAKGLKMSKHLGNIVQPDEVLDTVGADATRWHFYTSSAPWTPTRFSRAEVEETQRKFLLTLANVYNFYVLYADIDGFNPSRHADYRPEHVMDRWIVSLLHSTVRRVGELLDAYDVTSAALAIESFVDELSNWYVRRCRARFWQDGMGADKAAAYMTLYTVLSQLCRLAAPFVPFITEAVWRGIVVPFDPSAPESVHFASWPKYDELLIDPALEAEMDRTYRLVELGRRARASANFKNRQPLPELLIAGAVLPDYYADVIRDELNVKHIDFNADMSRYVNFDIKPNLPVLGKQYGRHIPAIRQALSARDPMRLALEVQAGGSVPVELGADGVLRLDASNLLIGMNGKLGFAFAGEGELGVVLDTALTPELIEEGYVRELLSKLQNMRRESGFDVTDNITVDIACGERLEQIVRRNEELIRSETLAREIRYADAADAAEVKVNDETARVRMERIK